MEPRAVVAPEDEREAVPVPSPQAVETTVESEAPATPPDVVVHFRDRDRSEATVDSGLLVATARDGAAGAELSFEVSNATRMELHFPAASARRSAVPTSPIHTPRMSLEWTTATSWPRSSRACS